MVLEPKGAQPPGFHGARAWFNVAQRPQPSERAPAPSGRAAWSPPADSTAVPSQLGLLTRTEPDGTIYRVREPALLPELFHRSPRFLLAKTL